MSFALSSQGQLWAWGSNSNGEQGKGAWGWSGATPCVVDKLSDGRLAAVCCAFQLRGPQPLRQRPQGQQLPQLQLARSQLTGVLSTCELDKEHS
jgi:hypothetical protein